MRQLYLLSFLTAYLVTVTTAASNLVCYYDSSSYTREGKAAEH